ncbi:MAG TPA: hypothetical protein VJM46_03725 [Candidatus Saccharimonadales bacterium]|nr:hypothetical protein [Candidatus Saccharimonadales bacterium]
MGGNMPEDPRRERMLTEFVAERVPFEISTIVVGGPVLDLPMTMQVYACAYADTPTYEVFQTDNSLGTIDTAALRREIAALRIPDRVNVVHTEDQAQRGLRRAIRVSRHLDVPVGFYAKGYYNNRKKTALRVLMYMGFLPAPVFLNRLKHVATG